MGYMIKSRTALKHETWWELWCSQSGYRVKLFFWKKSKVSEGPEKVKKAQMQNKQVCAHLRYMGYMFKSRTTLKHKTWLELWCSQSGYRLQLFYGKSQSFRRSRKGKKRPKYKTNRSVHIYIIWAI